MKGYPTQGGTYWVRMYGWNEITHKYDLPSPEWIIVEVDTSENPKYQVEVIGSDEGDDVRRIYEYREAEKPQ